MYRRMTMQQALDRPVILGAFFLVALLTGCSDNRSTGSVSGKVTYQGKPVEGGTLTFIPEEVEGKGSPGKPGAAEISADGTYTVSTYGHNDGAVIGTHKIRFSPAAVPIVPKELKQGESQTPAPAAKSPYDGLVPKQSSVEIKSGNNTVDIELELLRR